MYKTAMYPGTFDPITNGHLDIIRRASLIFERVIVAVAQSANKKPQFSLEERIEMIQKSTLALGKVQVLGFCGLLADFATEQNTVVVVRGLRAVSDFEYELQMGYTNTSLKPELETIYFMPNLKNAFISSSIVRAILEHGGKISHLVPEPACAYLREKGYKCM
ncbi:MAG: pantetheine-phosphate adenylyltransferase [Helicobacter sp.]|nr:pantetheine-phosphate adenylyltransferase [Helicobacter sp.]